MRNTLLDCNIDLFRVFPDFFSIAGLALSTFTDNLSLTLAIVTILLDLLIHSWTHLEHLDDLASSFTLSALADILSSFSLAISADSGPLMV
jgi:hypothetical protein